MRAETLWRHSERGLLRTARFAAAPLLALTDWRRGLAPCATTLSGVALRVAAPSRNPVAARTVRASRWAGPPLQRVERWRFGIRGLTGRAAVDGALGGGEAAANIISNLVLAGMVYTLVSQIAGKRELYPPAECLPGKAERIKEAPPQDATHLWLGDRNRPLYPPFPEDTEMAMFAMGCFWCSENIFMRIPRGVYTTAVGYSGGVTPNPTYGEVCGGKTNHAEVVRVIFQPSEISYETLLRKFWEAHDPTTYNGQGSDFGTPYRSSIYTFSDEQKEAAIRTRDQFQGILKARGQGAPICTEIAPAGEFYYAEGYHQQYDARGNAEYCGLRPTGASFIELPVAAAASAASPP